MATVQLAEDLKHERKVALRMLRPEQTEDGGCFETGGGNPYWTSLMA